MSSDVVKIKVKFDVNEIEIETTREALKDTINAAQGLIQELKASKPTLGHPSKIWEEVKEIPAIKIEKGESLPSIITKLFSTEWGRKPRKLMEVKETLESYGLIYPRQSVAVALLRLAKDGKLRRFKGADEEYLYTATTGILEHTG
jgi:hypothetical protein